MDINDNKGIIADCVDEIQPFTDEVIPSEKRDEELMTENMDITIPAEDFFSGNNFLHYYINLLIGLQIPAHLTTHSAIS